ncbi:MAG: glycosyltransferase family 4 protein [Bacteroidota bacterium]
MHILLIPSWYPSKKEPFSGNFVKRHAELIAQNHQVTVLNFVSDSTKEIHFEETQTGNLFEISIYYPKKNNKIIQVLALRRAFLKVAKKIKNVDLIHGHVILEKGLLFIWAKNYFKKRLFVTEHGSYFFRENYGKLSTFQKMTIIQTMKNCDYLSCVSEVLKDEIAYLFPHKKIVLTPNSIDSEVFNIGTSTGSVSQNEEINFIHISTLDQVKNPIKIIQAFEDLSEETNHQFSLKIIAEKSNLEVISYLEKSKIKDKISLLGPLQIEEVAEELKKSDALVMLSNFETFSCVIAEAWSCGIPVISTSVGIAKNMHSDFGVLVKNTESEALTICLNEFMEAKKVYDKKKIRTFALQFSKEHVLKSFDEFYAQKK